MNPDRHDPGTVRAALAYVDPNVARKEWAKVAFALKSELGEDGFTLFDEWSQGGQTYKVKEVRSAWKSAKAGGSVTIGTLFSMASADRREDAIDRGPGRRVGGAHRLGVDPHLGPPHPEGEGRCAGIGALDGAGHGLSVLIDACGRGRRAEGLGGGGSGRGVRHRGNGS